MVLHTLVMLSAVGLPPVMPIADIAPGQRGECLTVFEGASDNIEPFPFRVKGVMPSFLGPGRDLVLIRLEGDKAEFTGVVAGMSGSPCSIDGKLVGALSYSFATFAKEPIAGVTPIGDMLDVMKLPEQPRPWRLARSTKKDAKATGESTEWSAFRSGQSIARAANSDGLTPISAPLSMGGVPPEVRQHFAPYLESIGFMPVASGAGGAGKTRSQALKPGSAVAAVLVKGDVNISATGTVTTVEDNVVTAFGHPFFGAGAISVPMANATIVNTMASSMRSFKQSIAGATVGEVTQDRLPAIGGYIGNVPRTVPVTGVIRTAAGDSEFRFEVARDLSLTPRFVAIGLASSMSGRVDAGQRGLVRFKGTVTVDGLEPVVIEDVYSGQRDPGLLAYSAVDVAQTMASLWNTDLGPPPKMSIHLDAKVEPEPLQEQIETMYLDRGVVRAGEPFRVSVRLRQEYGGIHYETFNVEVPRSWAGGEVELFALSAIDATRLAEEIEGRPRPNSLKQIARYLNKHRGDGHVYFMAVRRGASLSTEVDTHAFLPPSAVAIFGGGSPYANGRLRGLALEERRRRPGVVVGGARLQLKVEQPL